MCLKKVLPFILLFASCGSDNVGSGFLSNNSRIFTTAGSLMSSAATNVSNSSLIASPVLNLKSTPTCDSTGSTSVAVGTVDYAGEQVFCNLTTNSKSPDTPQGSLFLMSSVLCAIEKQYSFSYGLSLTTKNNIQIPESDSCFGPGGFDSNSDGDTIDMIDLSLRESRLSNQDFDFYVELHVGSSTFSAASHKFYLKDSGGILAGKIVEVGVSGYIIEVKVDSNSNVFSFENKDYSNTRHIRLRVSGNYNVQSGVFSNITDARMIYANNTTDQIIFGFDGNNEFYDFHDDSDGSSDGTGYPSNCSGSCSSLGTNFDSSFAAFGTAASTYDNSTLIDLSTFNMTF